MQIIKASEIGEFHYCCLSWWLRKKGIKPLLSKVSKLNIQKGIKRHEEIGKQITNVQKQEVQINHLNYTAYIILALIIFAIIFFLTK